MRVFGQAWEMSSVAAEMKRWAMRGFYYGVEPVEHLERFKALHLNTGTQLIFTRDRGMHSCGWLKNPDYEQCLHLSLSYWILPDGLYNPALMHPSAWDGTTFRLTRKWIDAFFGEAKRYLWEESAKSPEGRKMEIRHYRVFCNPAWEPILPRKEVYNREFTEAGWKSYSEIMELQDWIVPADTQ